MSSSSAEALDQKRPQRTFNPSVISSDITLTPDHESTVTQLGQDDLMESIYQRLTSRRSPMAAAYLERPCDRLRLMVA